MFCDKCGSEVPAGAATCPKCGASVNPGAPRVVPFSSKLALAIIVTIFCCWPFGIPAIVCAAKANARFNNGDLNGALEYNRKASMWTWICFGVGLAFDLIYGLICIAAA